MIMHCMLGGHPMITITARATYSGLCHYTRDLARPEHDHDHDRLSSTVTGDSRGPLRSAFHFPTHTGRSPVHVPLTIDIHSYVRPRSLAHKEDQKVTVTADTR
jgi:hypothetical protein